PNKPVDPTDPNTPNYPNPDKDDILKLTKEVSREVRYYVRAEDGSLKEVPASEAPMHRDVLRFRREGSINLVTGETTLGDWV
ncbi:hypothetical protein IR117_12840, partial [Streptococcus danieliae]|nr:hypothetical protein [Streptococcus danieliae]